MLTQEKTAELKEFAKQIRVQTLEQMATRGFGHLGGAMSMVEILSVLYGSQMKYDPRNPKWDGRDWLVCSKGHAGPSLYSALALKGFFPVEELLTLNQRGTKLPSHCDRNKTVGIDMTTGSLGQGLSLAAGLAFAHKLRGEANTVYAIVGDGELQEGQNWEAMMFSAQRGLDNLIVLVDNNHVQLDGVTADISNMESLDAKFAAFNWDAQRVDGHDLNALDEAIEKAKQQGGKPHAIIADTEKGKGVFWAEGQFNHHIEVSREAADEAINAILKQ
ncbi:MAG: transketolase [Clostridiales Family XIII bacterium]|jgi:transketolase|nr:transketolase [Clostridiales Family XIII bacterium]